MFILIGCVLWGGLEVQQSLGEPELINDNIETSITRELDSIREADSLFQRGEYEDAIEEYEKIAYRLSVKERAKIVEKPNVDGKEDFDTAEKYFKEGKAQKDYDTLLLAYTSYKLAIANNPGSQYIPSAYYRIGDIMLEQSKILDKPSDKQVKVEEAINAYKEATRLYPDVQEAEFPIFWLGSLYYYRKGNPHEAIFFYQKLRDNFPKGKGQLTLVDNAQFMLARCYLDKGDILTARAELKKLTEGYTFEESIFVPDAYLKLGDLFHTLEEYREKEATYRECLKKASDAANTEKFAEALMKLGMLYFQVRYLDNAIYCYQKVINSDATALRKDKARLNLAEVYFEKNEFKSCSELIKQLQQSSFYKELSREDANKACFLLADSLYFQSLLAGSPSFSIDVKFQTDLDDNSISEDLQQEFKNNGFSLPQDATVLNEGENGGWMITAKNTSGLMQKYAVGKEGERLKIYVGSEKDCAKQALKAYMIASAEKPLGIYRSYRLARACIKADECNRAVKLLEKDIERFKKQSSGSSEFLNPYYLALGDAFYALKEYDKAVKKGYSRVTGSSREHALRQTGLCHLELEQFDEALAVYTDLQTEFSDSFSAEDFQAVKDFIGALQKGNIVEQEKTQQ